MSTVTLKLPDGRKVTVDMPDESGLERRATIPEPSTRGQLPAITLPETPPPIPEVISPERRRTAQSRTPMEAARGATATELARIKHGLRRMRGLATGDIQTSQSALSALQELGQEAQERAQDFPIASIAGATAPFMILPAAAFGGPARALATGAAFGAIPSGGDPMATGLGAAGGLLGAGALRHIARPVTPSPQAQILMRQGIQPSVGQGIAQGPGLGRQLVGRTVRRAEEAFQSMPVAGSAFITARRRPQAELTQAALNRAMPFGERIPPDTPVRDALNMIRDRSRQGYSEIYGSRIFTMKPANLGALQRSVQDKRILANKTQRDAVTEEIGQLLNLGKVGETGFTGDTVKFTQSKLRERARAFIKTQDPAQREIGKLYENADRALTKWIRSNLTPDEKRVARELDRAYANQLRVERAASALGAEEGEFTAAQLQNAVKAMAGGVRKSEFARGQALMQDLSEPAKTVLTGKVPDSGTPERLMYNLLGATGIGGVTALDPVSGAALASGAGLSWLGSTRPLQRYMLGGYPGQAAAMGPAGVVGGVTGAQLPGQYGY